MLSYSDVAVFVLGTTAVFHGQSSYISRLLPIHATWGAYFPNLFIVFGSSVKDHGYLQNCMPSSSMVYNNKTESYTCPGILISQKHMNVLRFLNCSSGYYGDGPTCRCQESMRYFYHMRHTLDLQWFIFQDDDIYLRHQPFLLMLSHISSSSDEPIAIVSAKLPRGLFFSSSWNRTTNSACSRHMFPIAQPAFLNLPAMNALTSLIHAGGLMHLRHIWRGTHDHLLGLSLWLYNITVKSVYDSYYTAEISSVASLDPMVISHTIIYHRMRNWNASHKSRSGAIMKKTVIGQQQLHDYLTTNQDIAASTRMMSVDAYLHAMGDDSYHKLFAVKTSSPYNHSNSMIVAQIRNIRERYINYTVSYC